MGVFTSKTNFCKVWYFHARPNSHSSTRDWVRASEALKIKCGTIILDDKHSESGSQHEGGLASGQIGADCTMCMLCSATGVESPAAAEGVPLGIFKIFHIIFTSVGNSSTRD
jgi:hypothetical protein